MSISAIGIQAPSVSIQTGSRPEGIGQPTLAEQMRQALFGRPTPPILDPYKYPELLALLRRLNNYRRKITHFANELDSDYTLVLADEVLAAVNDRGVIYLGADFLLSQGKNTAVLVGAMAHEIGHQPKKWRDPRLTIPGLVTLKQRQELCRLEESKADKFAGEALAELNLPAEPLAEFLALVQKTPHPEYLDAQARGQIILAGHASQHRYSQLRRQLFPAFERASNARLYVGEF